MYTDEYTDDCGRIPSGELAALPTLGLRPGMCSSYGFQGPVSDLPASTWPFLNRLVSLVSSVRLRYVVTFGSMPLAFTWRWIVVYGLP